MEETQSVKGAELAFLALLLRRAEMDVRSDATVTDEERSSFFRAAGKYYRTGRTEIEGLAERGVSLDEIPVVLHLALHSALAPLDVLAMRQSGRSWSAVLADLNLSPGILHVPVSSPVHVVPDHAGDCYGRAAREAWNVLVLHDADVVNLVNMKFISEYYRYRPEQVVALRSTGWTYAAIHGGVARPRPVEKQRSVEHDKSRTK